MTVHYDVAVVGAGMAGLCCAARLALDGLRPLLISETAEVATTMRSEWVGQNRGLMQHPAWQVGWGGGWWYGLARELNLPLQLQSAPPINFTVAGSGVFHEITPCVSARSVMDLICKMSPLPLADVRDDFEAIVHEGLSFSPEALYALSHVPITQWLKERGASELVSHLFIALCANIAESTPELCGEHLSVYGAFGNMRSFLCGEANLAVIVPDAREGLAIPMARAIEERGGVVSRGRKVARVLTNNGRVTGVAFADGSEITADNVAIAAGNPRIPEIFETLPEEAIKPLEYSKLLEHNDFCTFAVLERPVVTLDRYIMMADNEGNNVAWVWPLHSLAPWTTEPGKQFVLAQSFFTPASLAAIGGKEAVYERMRVHIEELFPGYTDATVAFATQKHRHHWMSPLSHGPKLPRKSPTVDGLWYVGDGSEPLLGIGVEAASSAGVLGGRAISAAFKGQRSVVATGA